MLLMDINDIQLELSKIFNRVGRDYLAAIAYVTFVVQWFYNRIYIFGFQVIRSFRHYPYWDGCLPREGGLCDRLWPLTHILSWIIFLMSLYWSFLIVKKTYRLAFLLITSGFDKTVENGQDPRELDYEEKKEN